MASKKLPLYFLSVLLFMLLLPVVSIVIEHSYEQSGLGWALTGKWFIFWALGVRLFIAGIRQATKPAFTARDIFHMHGTESYPVIRELGFANLCLGLLGILSLYAPSFRHPAAIAGGLYFGLAGLLHVFKKPASNNELIALISDLFIFCLMAAYLVTTF